MCLVFFGDALIEIRQQLTDRFRLTDVTRQCQFRGVMACQFSVCIHPECQHAQRLAFRFTTDIKRSRLRYRRVNLIGANDDIDMCSRFGIAQSDNNTCLWYYFFARHTCYKGDGVLPNLFNEEWLCEIVSCRIRCQERECCNGTLLTQIGIIIREIRFTECHGVVFHCGHRLQVDFTPLRIDFRVPIKNIPGIHQKRWEPMLANLFYDIGTSRQSAGLFLVASTRLQMALRAAGI